MPPNKDYLPQSDAELKTLIRGVTGYDDLSSEFTDSDLDTQIQLAKMRLYNEYGTEAWYDDGGITQALLYLTAILSKCAIENYSTRRWDVGDQSFWSRDNAPDESAQFIEWTEAMNEGIDNSNSGSTTSVGPALTSNFRWWTHHHSLLSF